MRSSSWGRRRGRWGMGEEDACTMQGTYLAMSRPDTTTLTRRARPSFLLFLCAARDYMGWMLCASTTHGSSVIFAELADLRSTGFRDEEPIRSFGRILHSWQVRWSAASPIAAGLFFLGGGGGRGRGGDGDREEVEEEISKRCSEPRQDKPWERRTRHGMRPRIRARCPARPPALCRPPIKIKKLPCAMLRGQGRG